MARNRSSLSHGCWRFLRPSYYLKRPERLGLAVVAFVLVSFAVWDRQNLLREHDDEVYKLKEELDILKDKLQRLGQSVRSGEDTIRGDGKLINENLVTSDPIDNERREKVKEAMLHAWNSYEKYAWGEDELQPQSKNGVNNFGGLGATIVDSLDTLYIMGLKDQFEKAREWIANSLDFNKNYEASVFETTIRLLYKSCWWAT